MPSNNGLCLREDAATSRNPVCTQRTTLTRPWLLDIGLVRPGLAISLVNGRTPPATYPRAYPANFASQSARIELDLPITPNGYRPNDKRHPQRPKRGDDSVFYDWSALR